MSKVLENLLYSKTHEWCLVDGDVATIGISDYAQDSLGSIVYVETAEVGDELSQFEEFGAIESVKAASDLVAPVSGEVIEVNQDVIDNPELINEDPYLHWILKLRISSPDELKELVDAKSYQELQK